MYRRGEIFILLLYFSFFIFRISNAEELCKIPVKTSSGLVKGTNETGANACVWRGIPYAEPPLGELRWKSPKPKKPWDGVLETVNFGPRCMQTGIMELVNADPSNKMSEDCLYMNIWRPKKEGKFPVMVWIHGGGYTGGTANTPMYWGDRISEASDVVLVSFNYRLNIFGFFALPSLREEDENKSTGNYGSLDQVFALKWVKENIANFGGDPDNITIFGESAGGFSICTMLATPLAKGLFHKAIMESGGCETTETLEKGYKKAEEIAEKLGCSPDDLKCLRNISAKKLVKITGDGLGTAFGPHIDNYFLPDSPLALIRSSKFNNVPFMAGANKNEADILVKFNKKLKKAKPEQYRELVSDLLNLSPSDADELLNLYPLSRYDNSPQKAYGQIITDSSLGCPTYLGLASSAKFQNNTYYYRFDYNNTFWKESIGAVHSLEMPFIFNTMDRPPWNILLRNSRKYEKEMKELSRIMQGYWTNFAKTGNPNGPGLPQWPVFKPDTQEIIVFDKNIRTETFPKQDKCSFWDEHSHLRIRLLSGN